METTEAAKPTAEKKEEQVVIDRQDAQSFLERQFVGDMPTPAKPEDEVKPEPGKKVDEKPTPKPARRRPAAKVEPTAPDYEKLAEAAARGAAEGFRKVTEEPEKKQEEEKPEDTSFLSAQDRITLRDLGFAAKYFPEKYKEHAKKFIVNRRAELDYQKKWEKEHPGQDYNSEADEHNDFYAEHELDWDDSELDEASKRHYADESTGRLKKEYDEKLSEFEKKERAREIEPQVSREAKRNGREFFKLFGDQFKDVVGEDGTVNNDAIKKIAEEDPLAADIVFNEANGIEALCAESYRLFNNVTAYNEKNPNHKFLFDFAVGVESELKDLPRQKQVDDKGRAYLPSSEYYKLKEDKREKYWTLTAQDLNTMLTAELGKKVKTRLDTERANFEKRALRYGFSKGQSNGQNENNDQHEEPPAPSSKPRIVTGAAGAGGAPISKPGDHDPKNPEQSFIRRFIGG